MIACIRLPYFLATLHRSPEPSAAAHPLLIVYARSGRRRIVGFSEAAEHAGVHLDMPLHRALALCPEGAITWLAPVRVRQTLARLQVLLSTYSQWNEVERGTRQTALLYVDLGKLRRSEGLAMAEQLRADFAAQGFSASLGLAANKFTAFTAAQVTDVGSIRLIQRGEEAQFLAQQSIHHLPLDAELRRRLALFGLERIGQLAALPRHLLLAQFGQTGERLHRLACAEDLRRVARYTPPSAAAAARNFDPPIDNRLVLEAVLRRLSEEAAQRLAEQEQSCRLVALTLQLSNQREIEVERRLREPLCDAAALQRLALQLLQTLKPEAAISHLELRLDRLTPTLPRQLTLFDAPSAANPIPTLIDLSERYGSDCFYSVALNAAPAYLPELRRIFEKVEIA